MSITAFVQQMSFLWGSEDLQPRLGMVLVQALILPFILYIIKAISRDCEATLNIQRPKGSLLVNGTVILISKTRF